MKKTMEDIKHESLVKEAISECTKRQTENNHVKLVGEIISEYQFSHEVYDKKFYTTELAVQRYSDFTDYIPVLVSEDLVNVAENHCGQIVSISGEFRSYNYHNGTRSKLLLMVLVKSITFVENTGVDDSYFENNIVLNGYLCKEPLYRKTPLGREIADLLIAVNRSCGKSDYIPCICWGRNARYASTFGIGTNVKLYGRIQSREYIKKHDNAEPETRIAYEVSVSDIKLIEE